MKPSIWELAAFTVTLFSMLATVVAAIATSFNVKISKNLLEEQSLEAKRLRMPFITVKPSKWKFQIQPFFSKPIEDEESDDDDFSYHNEDDSFDDELLEIYESITINGDELLYRDRVLEYTNELNIEFFNVHYGVAKEIEIKIYIENLSYYTQKKWENYIVSSIFEKFELVDDYAFLKLNFSNSITHGERNFTKESNKEYLVMRGIESNIEERYREKIDIEIPTAFIFLLAMFSREYVIDRDTKFLAPRLKIEITCKDIFNEKHEFEINYYFKGIEYNLNYQDQVVSVTPNYETNCKKK